MADIFFRPVMEVEATQVASWYARPHVTAWLGSAPSPSTVVKWLARGRDGVQIPCYLIMEGEAPIGFVRLYRVASVGGDWWPGELDMGAHGFEFILADGARLGKGLGTRVAKAFIGFLFGDPEITRVQVAPNPAHLAALACFRKAGMADAGPVETPDGPAWLLSVDRAAWEAGPKSDKMAEAPGYETEVS